MYNNVYAYLEELGLDFDFASAVIHDTESEFATELRRALTDTTGRCSRTHSKLIASAIYDAENSFADSEMDCSWHGEQKRNRKSRIRAGAQKANRRREFLHNFLDEKIQEELCEDDIRDCRSHGVASPYKNFDSGKDSDGVWRNHAAASRRNDMKFRAREDEYAKDDTNSDQYYEWITHEEVEAAKAEARRTDDETSKLRCQIAELELQLREAELTYDHAYQYARELEYWYLKMRGYAD